MPRPLIEPDPDPLGALRCGRYTSKHGVGVRVTPWVFVFPGLQIVAKLLEWLFQRLLGHMERLEDETQRRRRKQSEARLLDDPPQDASTIRHFRVRPASAGLTSAACSVGVQSRNRWSNATG
jgi:hypothetical protein